MSPMVILGILVFSHLLAYYSGKNAAREEAVGFLQKLFGGNK